MATSRNIERKEWSYTCLEEEPTENEADLQRAAEPATCLHQRKTDPSPHTQPEVSHLNFGCFRLGGSEGKPLLVELFQRECRPY